MTSLPTVTVVIAAYNRPAFLREAIQSVLEQTYAVDQIIVVDDYSPIDLMPIVSEFSSCNIIYHRKQKNMGVSNSRNVGIELATADYVAILDDDDLYTKDKISTQLAYIQSIEGCIASLTSCAMLGSSPNVQLMPSGLISDDDLRRGNPYVGLLAKRDELLHCLYDESLTLGEDWDVYIRMKTRGEIHFCNEPLYLYRKGSHDSLTSKAKTLSIEDVEHRLAVTYKNRAWLGEKYFKIRIARVMLSYIWVKNNKLNWLRSSFKRAGLMATFRVLFIGVLSKIIKRKIY